MKNNIYAHTFLGLLALTSSAAQAAVVFSEIDLTANTITLTNTDAADADLSGWRFCSHDLDSSFVYSGVNDFNGVTIGAGESLVVDTTSIAFAGLLGGNTMSIGLYNDLDGSLSFGSANDLSAFIQFAPEGTTNVGNAETRTGTAVTAGLWDSTGSFVEIAAGDTQIILNDLNSATGAASFSAVPEPSSTLLVGLASALMLSRRRRTV